MAVKLPEYAGNIRRIDGDPGHSPLRVTLDDIDDQRANGWPDFHPEEYCHRCGGRNVPWWTDGATWNPVMRDESGWGPWQEIICIPCFIELAELQQGPQVWRVTRDQYGTEVLIHLAEHDREVIDASESRERDEWERAETWRRKANGYAWALRSIQSEIEAWRNTGLPDDRLDAIASILDTPRPETPRVDRIERGAP